MSVKLSVKITGAEGILAKFSKFDIETTTAVRKAITKSANRIRKTAKNRVPVDTGEMKKRIRASYSKDKLSAEIGPRTGFASLVEFGTVRTQARPFMTPTWEEERKNYEDAIRDAIKGVMR